MNKLLCSVCAFCLLTALLTGCGGTGVQESTASPNPSATTAVQTADPSATTAVQTADPSATTAVQTADPSATPTETPESADDLTGTIESKDGLFLIDKDLFASQLDLVLQSFGYGSLPNPEKATGEKTGPNGEMVFYERYDVGSGVILTLCADENDGSLAEIVLTASSGSSDRTYSDFQKCCVDMIDFDDSKTILDALEDSEAGTTAIHSENALYIQSVNDSVTILQIIPRN